jgi:hypothetical protein
VKDENGDLLADSHTVLKNGRKTNHYYRRGYAYNAVEAHRNPLILRAVM